jgi:L-lactate dehydrogenase complex protein LldG
MSSRDNILRRVRTALKDDPPQERPPVPEVWRRETSDPAALALRFQNELEAVHGELHRCGSMDEARQKLVELMDLSQWPAIGAVDTLLAQQLTAGLPPERIGWAAEDWTPVHIADLPASLVAADCLLADTGTCMVACATTHERLMCYLPPVCIVIAQTDRLFEHLPAAWEDLADRFAAPELRGEHVFITGPSRTADIEKILILGVHGPKRLIVLLVG